MMNFIHTDSDTKHFAEHLFGAGPHAVSAYENAAVAIGRLDAAAALAPSGLSELLVLRCAAQPFAARRDGMIALLRPNGESDDPLRRLSAQLRAIPVRPWRDDQAPPVLAAAIAARDAMLDPRGSAVAVPSAALAATTALRAGGAIGGPWLTFPLGAGSPLSARHDDLQAAEYSWAAAAFGALEREARAVERGLAAARHRVDADAQRVRDSLGRAAYSALDVLEFLRARLAITVPGASRALSLTPPTANAAVARLEAMGIAREITGQERSRVFVYAALIDALAP